MLSELRVENFALMEDVSIRLGRGLIVFTGETGAGKSMLVDALGVLLGGRASTEFIRYGKDQARIEGVFSDLPDEIANRLQEEGYDLEDGQLILFREINRSGRNICRVQGRTVPLSLYRSLSTGLVDIHGQMEHQSLLNEENHLKLLDAFGGPEHLEIVSEVARVAKNYLNILKREQEFLNTQAERQRQEDFLRYQIEEIERINPQPGEEEQLTKEKQLLLNRERLIALVNDSYAALYEGAARQPSAYDLLSQALKNLQEISRLDPSCAELESQIESLYYSLEDTIAALRDYRDRLDFEPGRLEQIEERLIELSRLKKYGVSIEDVMKLKEQMQSEIEFLSSLDEQLAELSLRKEQSWQQYQALAQNLSHKRQKLAKKLTAELSKELADLGITKGQFQVHFEKNSSPNSRGMEHVSFYFSANPGEPPKPLAKVASGGEMSRLMLAMKSLFARLENVPTFIFDEVESGVGGMTIQKVAEKLVSIAEVKQVICITHSPIIAAQADIHYGITKYSTNDSTKTIVKALTEEERVQELTRMLGGESDIARMHALELWRQKNRA